MKKIGFRLKKLKKIDLIFLTHYIGAIPALTVEWSSIWVSGVAVGSWVTVSVVVDGWESVSVCVVVISGISLGFSLTLGNLVNDSGGRAGVVAGDSLVCNGGNDGGGVRDGVDGWDNDGLSVGNWSWSWVSDNNGLLFTVPRGLLGCISLDSWCGVDDGVVLVVHGGVVVVHGWDDVLGGYSWGGVCLVDVLATGVVVKGIGFRLSEGHGGESENYELENKIKIINIL